MEQHEAKILTRLILSITTLLYMLTTKLTAEKQSCAMCIVNEVWLITNYTCSQTHTHTNTHTIITICCAFNWPTIRCQGKKFSVVRFYHVKPFCQHKKCHVRLLRPNQWNSLFYILNSKLSQGSKHGAMVSTNYPTTQPSATSHKSETRALSTSYLLICCLTKA